MVGAVLLVALCVALGACDATCPPGSHREGAPPPGGAAVRCVDGDGRLEGPFRLYHANGALFVDSHYAAGRLDGMARKWYADGTPMAQGAFVGNAKDGPWVFFHPNGRVERQGSYGAGRRIGAWRCFTSAGLEDADACR